MEYHSQMISKILLDQCPPKITYTYNKTEKPPRVILSEGLVGWFYWNDKTKEKSPWPEQTIFTHYKIHHLLERKTI